MFTIPKKTFLILATTLLFSFVSTKEIILKPSTGVDNIIVGKSTIEDVSKIYAGSKVKKVKVKATETELCSHSEYEIYYEAEDILFKTSYPKKSKVVEKIVIGANSKIKTENGFGIGSSYNDMQTKFGGFKDVYFVQLLNNVYETKVKIEKMNVYFTGKDTLNGKAIRIEIF